MEMHKKKKKNLNKAINIMTGLTFENENILLGYLLKIETMATVSLSGTYMIVWYSTVCIFPEK